MDPGTMNWVLGLSEILQITEPATPWKNIELAPHFANLDNSLLSTVLVYHSLPASRIRSNAVTNSGPVLTGTLSFS